MRNRRYFLVYLDMIEHSIFIVLISLVSCYQAVSLNTFSELGVLVPYVLWFFLYVGNRYFLDAHIERQSQPLSSRWMIITSFFCFECILITLSLAVSGFVFGIQLPAFFTYCAFVLGVIMLFLSLIHWTQVSTQKSREETMESSQPYTPKQHFTQSGIQKAIHIYLIILYTIIFFSTISLLVTNGSLYPIVYFIYPLFLVGFFQKK